MIKNILKEVWGFRMIFTGLIVGILSTKLLKNEYIDVLPLGMYAVIFLTIVAYIDWKICNRLEEKDKLEGFK